MSRLMQVLSDAVAMTAEPVHLAEATNELLHGEQFEVAEEQNGFAYGRAVHDSYEGWVPAQALTNRIYDADYKVKALRTFLYPRPDFKAPPVMSLSFLSRVLSTEEEKDGFVKLAVGAWIWKEHLMEHGHKEPDSVETALRFSETAYLWGGRTSSGVDCSGLIQLCLMASGVPCPRDSAQQTGLGAPVEFDDSFKPSNLQRGDIVHFKGHVGIMLDERQILNASARTMSVRSERLSALAEFYNGITDVRRL